MEAGEPHFGLVVTHDGSRPICRVNGDLDLMTAPEFGKVLTSFIEIGELEIDLDLSAVDFLDSQGINELVRAHRNGLRIIVTAASPAARRVLDLAQLEPVLAEPTAPPAADAH